MSEIPWWSLPLVAAVFALAGAGVTVLVSARDDYVRSRAKRTRRWYAERRDAYVALLTQFERATYRLRVALETGQRMPGPYTYVDEVGPALMQVRLLASGQVRSAALAVHVLLEKLYGERPAPPRGVDPAKSLREMLGHVPLVMQELEAAIREELGIEATPPPPGEAPQRSSRSLRSYLRRGAPLAGAADSRDDRGN
ncbi:hypothetical protein AB0M36_02495 [Actinoplanes sp. NPDC051346]|uniref:hypothetical protein n=1 Tax=Actinoplanes sp. NPDC051346 TaxID=3155048 RepID=UPI003432EF3E